jgi:hypothetical protein
MDNFSVVFYVTDTRTSISHIVLCWVTQNSLLYFANYFVETVTAADEYEDNKYYNQSITDNRYRSPKILVFQLKNDLK